RRGLRGVAQQQHGRASDGGGAADEPDRAARLLAGRGRQPAVVGGVDVLVLGAGDQRVVGGRHPQHLGGGRRGRALLGGGEALALQVGTGRRRGDRGRSDDEGAGGIRADRVAQAQD